MNYSLLVILFVIIVISLTGEAEEIFGVEVSTVVGRTLEKDKVEAEMAAKRQVLQEVRALEKTLPIKGRKWLLIFRELVNVDMKIVQSLETDVSYLNSEFFRNLNNNQKIRDHISNSDWKILETGLQNYTKLMQTFSFDQILWDRKFMQNPFEYFFTRIGQENSEYLAIKKLEPAFKKALDAAKKAQEKIATLAKSLNSNLSPQFKISHLAMAELRDLDIQAICSVKKNIENRVVKSIKLMEKLLKSVENVNKVPFFKKIFKSKSPWLDCIVDELEAVELAHKNLEIDIGIIYP